MVNKEVFSGTFNKRLKSFLAWLLLIFLGFPNSTKGQPDFIKSYYIDGNQTRINPRLAICPDNGYIIAFSAFDGIDSKMHVRKFSECDELLWSKTLNPTINFNNRLYDLDVGPNGDIYLLTNHPSRTGIIGYNYGVIIQLNSEGKTITTKKVSGTLNGKWSFGNEGAVDLLIRSNGGIVYSGTGGFIEMDQNYNVLFSEEHSCHNPFENFKGDLIYSGGGGGRTITSRDQNFQYKWIKKFKQFNLNRYGFEVINDGILYLNIEEMPGSTLVKSNLYKLDFDGNIVWQSEELSGLSVYQQIQTTDMWKPFQISNGDIITCSQINSKSFWFHKFDKKGKYLESFEIDLSPEGGSNTPVEGIHALDVIYFNGDIILTGSYGSYDKSHVPNLFIARINDDFSSLSCINKTKLVSHNSTFVEMEIGYNINTQNEVLIEDHSIQYTDINIIESTLCSEFEGNAKVDTNLCFNSKATLYPSKNFKEYLWSTGSVEDSILVDSEGTYWMKGYDGCNYYTDSFDVQYTPDPELNYSISDRFASIDEDIEFISLTENIKHLRWNISDGYLTNQERFSYRFLENGLYTVVYSFLDQYNCYFEDSTQIKVKLLKINVPNSFTPNSDGKNDLFEPIGFGINTYRLRIYDRWGGLISDQIDKAWSGDNSAGGMYMYHLTITDVFGDSEESKGTFNLIR